ncbi:MAG: ribosomal subunit interface protein [Candidatus Cloacimonetes bacterium 4572_65]|nr:MAG: ribosomal subunit interface protein [Candidatus Cloacimonetes bacterium 4572_65]
MHISITARHFELTNAIRDHVEESLFKLKRFFDQIITIHVTLALENNRNSCEISLHASKFSLQSDGEAMDMYIAIDETIERMESQIKKLKDKVTDHQKRSMKENLNPYYSRADHYRKGNSQKSHKLIKTKRVVPDTLTIDEAMEKFEIGDKSYFIFKNVETDRINVLVKKDETHFKLLQP